ncbi:hypothetical protein GF340_03830 [Candidatus Peregrinibacteria bacterium]|nr:hypothetical protein [Candidatus Peregrinibacteria bacterium]
MQIYKMDPVNKIESKGIKSSQKEQIGKDDLLEVDNSEFIEGVSETLDDLESAEVMSGKISEKVSENKSKAPKTKFPAQTSGQGMDFASAEDEEPEIDVMRIQVSTQVKKEIAELKKEAKKMLRARSFNPFEVTKTMSKIRNLKDLLSSLAYVTSDALKTLWRKYIKGSSH